ncbi:DUF805 domain-containing protein [Macrococcus equi]|uniref:DUF805 domain-containing protein n=1 Tax=Macrococcus equi TaxID=3395462 RepID=UPI0039BE7CF7
MERDLTMKEACISFWKNGLNFRGRARRAEYWLPLLAFTMIIFLGMALAIVIDILTGFKLNITENVFIPALDILYWILFIPFLSLAVRRLQDININGIYAIIVSVAFIPVLLMSYFYTEKELYNFDTTFGKVYTILYVSLIVIDLILFILAMKEGTRGPNKYGADRKYIEDNEEYMQR